MSGFGKHTVTVYNVLPEVERQAAWRRTVLEGVTVEERSGAVAAMNGSTASDGLMLFVPGRAGTYVPPAAFPGTLGYTLRAGDVVVMGALTSAAPPAGTHIYRITGVERFDGPRGQVHHFEVAAS
ncbi:MAG: hypothetical protein ACYCXZ_06565 [Coriobacteriia bacterium]